MNALGLDGIFIAETRAGSIDSIRHSFESVGLHIVAALRPTEVDDTALRPCTGGGVAFASRADVIMERVAVDTRGGICVKLLKPNSRPIYIIGLYLPTRSSKRRAWRQPLLQWAREQTTHCIRLSGDPRCVVVCGDFNAQHGATADHATNAYINPKDNSARGASRGLREWCASTHLLPSLGRPNAPIAYATSNRASGGGLPAENDYVMMHQSLRHGVDYRCLPPPDQFTLEPEGHEHVMVAVELCVPAAASAAPKPNTPRRQRRIVHVPAYKSRQWYRVAHEMRRQLLPVTDLLTDSEVPFSTAHTAVTKALQKVTDKTLRDPSLSLRTHAFRTFNGRHVPAQAVRLFAEARGLRRRINEAHRAGASIGRLATLRGRAKSLQKMGKKLSHDHDRKRAVTLARVAAVLRRDDPHALYRALETAAPANSLVFDSSASAIPCNAAGVPPIEFIPAFVSATLAETRVPGGDAASGLAAPASTVEQWAAMRRDVPSAAHDLDATARLAQDFTRDEVYNSLFPTSRHFRPQPCHANCKICAEHLNAYDDWLSGGCTTVPPEWKPRLQTSVSAGPDDIIAELLRWARPELPDDRLAYRMELSAALAALLTKALREGSVPAAFAEATIAALLKTRKDGTPLDATQGASYRYIAVSDTLSKLLSTLLAGRISHWALLHGIIDRAQIGFMPMHGAELHVFTLTETIKARLRRGEHTAVLFVDLRRAYDELHRPTLWRVLEHMGIPDNIIRLLDDWSSKRTARVRVNGSLSDPIALSKGCPQGDPLSPLLFNLFIESLSRRLATACPGVRAIGEVHINRLLYADDIAVLGADRTALVHALAVISEWCTEWGMAIGCGNEKTEAVFFAGQRPDGDATAYEPLQHGTARVVFVTEYKYLGLFLRHDLDGTPNTRELAKDMRNCYARYFQRSELARYSPIRSLLQLYKTVVLGGIIYLRCIVDLDSNQHDTISGLINIHAARICELHKKTSLALRWVQSRLFTLEGMISRDRERLSLQLQRTPFQSGVAATLYRALALEEPTASSTQGPAFNWVHSWRTRRAHLDAIGVPRMVPTSYSDVPRVAHVLGRAASYLEVREELHKHHPPPPDSQLICLPPPSAGSAKHTSALRFFMYPEAVALGSRMGYTPMSISGPGCSNALVATASFGRFPAVMSAALGVEAMQDAPFVPNKRKPGDPSPHARRVEAAPCRLCGAAESETIYHLLCECTQAGMTALRSEFAVSLRQRLASIWRLGKQVLRRAQICSPDLSALPDEGPADLETRGWRMLAYWTVLAVAWPARPCLPHISTPGFRTAAALGRLFDTIAVPPGLLNNLAHTWLTWSEQQLHLLAATWRSECARAAQGAAQPAP